MKQYLLRLTALVLPPVSHKIESHVVDGDDAKSREHVESADHVAVERERRRQIKLE